MTLVSQTAPRRPYPTGTRSAAPARRSVGGGRSYFQASAEPSGASSLARLAGARGAVAALRPRVSLFPYHALCARLEGEAELERQRFLALGRMADEALAGDSKLAVVDSTAAASRTGEE